MHLAFCGFDVELKFAEIRAGSLSRLAGLPLEFALVHSYAARACAPM